MRNTSKTLTIRPSLLHFDALNLTSLFALLILMLTSGCSTVIEGRTQKITIATSPAGAACTLKSNDDIIGVVSSTPDTIDVRKSKYDIIVECTKDGYVKAKARNHADYALTNLGNMALWHLSFVGDMVDNATGAGNKYDTQVYVEMEKAPPIVAAAAPAPTVIQYVIQPIQQQPVSQMAQAVTQSAEPEVLSTEQLVRQITPLPGEHEAQEFAQLSPVPLPEITPLPEQ